MNEKYLKKRRGEPLIKHLFKYLSQPDKKVSPLKATYRSDSGRVHASSQIKTILELFKSCIKPVFPLLILNFVKPGVLTPASPLEMLLSARGCEPSWDDSGKTVYWPWRISYGLMMKRRPFPCNNDIHYFFTVSRINSKMWLPYQTMNKHMLWITKEQAMHTANMIASSCQVSIK